MTLVSYGVLGLFWAAVLWRLPSALWGDTRRRALWSCFLGFALVWTLKTPAVDHGLDRSGVNDLSSLVKHVIAIGGINALLLMVTAMYSHHTEPEPPRYVRVARTVSRVATRAAAVTVVGLVLLFFFAIDRSRPTEHFITGHAGDPGMAAYMTLIYLYMGATAGVCLYQWGLAARRAPGGLLRTGLGMMTAAMLLADLYAVLRTAYAVYAAAVTPSTALGDLEENVTETLLLVLFPLLLLGATVPACRSVVDRVRALRSLARLHPLWRDLALAVPAPVMRPPSRSLPGRWLPALDRLVDVAGPDQSVTDRLGRWVTEIRDVFAELAYHGPPDLYERARRHACAHASAGACADDLAAAAEACWARAALAARAGGGSPAPTPGDVPTGAGDTLVSEVRWLARVAHHYAATDPEALRTVLTDKAHNAEKEATT
ncbi:MAB_1171c family putative transporter [Streptomyces sp. NPDC059740]|uniref:MAB_1171c family putative transporter n=1 Tax=Streptomyces sp. NPDC059740 TaxID=3346926 RepID=UPI00365AB644